MDFTQGRMPGIALLLYQILKHIIIFATFISVSLAIATRLIEFEKDFIENIFVKYSPYRLEHSHTKLLWNGISWQLDIKDAKIYDESNNLLFSSAHLGITPNVLKSAINNKVEIENVSLYKATFFSNDGASILKDFYLPANNINVINSTYKNDDYSLENLNIYATYNNGKLDIDGSLTYLQSDYKSSFKFQSRAFVLDNIVSNAKVQLFSNSTDVAILHRFLPSINFFGDTSMNIWLEIVDSQVTNTKLGVYGKKIFQKNENDTSKVILENANFMVSSVIDGADLSRQIVGSLKHGDGHNKSYFSLNLKNDNTDILLKNIDISLLENVLPKNSFDKVEKLGEVDGFIKTLKANLNNNNLEDSTLYADIKGLKLALHKEQSLFSGLNVKIFYIDNRLKGVSSSDETLLYNAKYLNRALLANNLKFNFEIDSIFADNSSVNVNSLEFDCVNSKFALDFFAYPSEDVKASYKYNADININSFDIARFKEYVRIENLSLIKEPINKLESFRVSNVNFSARDHKLAGNLEYSNLTIHPFKFNNILFPKIIEGQGSLELGSEMLNFKLNNNNLNDALLADLDISYNYIDNSNLKLSGSLKGRFDSKKNTNKEFDKLFAQFNRKFLKDYPIKSFDFSGDLKFDFEVPVAFDAKFGDYSIVANINDGLLDFVDERIKIKSIQSENLCLSNNFLSGDLSLLLNSSELKLNLNTIGEDNELAYSIKGESKFDLSDNKFISKIAQGSTNVSFDLLYPLTPSEECLWSAGAEVSLDNIYLKDDNFLNSKISEVEDKNIYLKYRQYSEGKGLVSADLGKNFSIKLNRDNLKDDYYISLKHFELLDLKEIYKYAGIYNSSYKDIFYTENVEDIKKKTELTLIANKLTIDNYSLGKNKFLIQELPKGYNLVLDSSILKGKMYINPVENIYFADFEHINIDESLLAKLPSSSNGDFLFTPANIDFKCIKLNYKDKLLFNIDASLKPTEYGFNFDRFYAQLKNSSILAAGRWKYGEGPVEAKIVGSYKTSDLQDSLNYFSDSVLFSETKGGADFYFYWKDSIIPKLDSLEGNINLKFRDGSIQGISQGANRILSFLNINNLGKRLRLDFKDLNRNSIFFSKLDMDLVLADKNAEIVRMTLASPSIEINCSGKTSLEDTSINVDIDVIPNVSSTLPIATTIATGNPLMAPISMLIDKFWGKELSSIARHKYELIGDWSNPQIRDYNQNYADVLDYKVPMS